MTEDFSHCLNNLEETLRLSRIVSVLKEYWLKQPRWNKKEMPVMCWFVNTCEHAEVPPLSQWKVTQAHVQHTHTQIHIDKQWLLFLFVNILCYVQATSVWCFLCCHGNRRLALTHHIRYLVTDARLLCLIHTHCMQHTRDTIKNCLILHLFANTFLPVLFYRKLVVCLKIHLICLLLKAS